MAYYLQRESQLTEQGKWWGLLSVKCKSASSCLLDTYRTENKICGLNQVDYEVLSRIIQTCKPVYLMSRDQNAERSHNMKVDNSSFERVEDIKYLGTTLTNQNSILEKINSILKPGNACYHSVQNLFFFQVAIQKFKY